MSNRKGQTLVILLIFIIVAISIATTSVSVIITNAQKTLTLNKSTEAYYAAEAGIENASISLLRDSTYAGETIQIQTGITAEVGVIYNGKYVVTSKGISGGAHRTIQAIFSYTNSVLALESWQEVFP